MNRKDLLAIFAHIRSLISIRNCIRFSIYSIFSYAGDDLRSNRAMNRPTIVIAFYTFDGLKVIRKQ